MEMKLILYDVAEENDFEILQMETDKDHVHLLVNYNPTQSILEVVRLLKQVSTFRMWRQNNNHKWLVKHFWKEGTFWSDGYFACSIVNISKATAEKYIQSQG
jgi:putative transposase